MRTGIAATPAEWATATKLTRSPGVKRGEAKNPARAAAYSQDGADHRKVEMRGH
jgi:hypothetical protein